MESHDAVFDGRLLTPADADWEEARVGRVFNGRRPDRQPDAILLAASVADVQRGVRLARDRGWRVAVRSGGHSWAAWSVRAGGLLIDLGALRDIEYDDETGVVSAGPATQGGAELSPFLEERGRFWGSGHCPSVGLGGFLLQGGQGWNQRGWGWAAEYVVAVDVVTADGALVRADATQNADLYWAARGAGPSFPGVVTRFHIRTRPKFGYLGHTVHMYELEDFTEVMTWLYEAHHRVSTDVEIVVVSLVPSAAPGEEPKRRFVVTAVAMVDDREAALIALAPFNDCPAIGRAVFAQDCKESDLGEQRVLQKLQNPEHAQYITDNIWVDGDPSEVVERIRPLFTELPTPMAFAIWMSNGPTRELPDMAFSLQTEAYVAAYTVYEDPAEYRRNRAWLDAAMEHAQPVTAGQYLGDSDMTNRQLRFMAEENWQKLQRVIAERDPEGRFHRYLAKDPSTLNRNQWEV
jgi:FAD/FMN-containing dehydrogenase